MELNLEKALQIIEQTCMLYRGDLKEHQAIQESLRIIKAELSANKKTENTEAK